MIKVVWDCDRAEEVTWKTTNIMKHNFPKWFEKREKEAVNPYSRINPTKVGEACNIFNPQ